MAPIGRDMSTPIAKTQSSTREVKAEVRQIREAAQRIATSKEAANRFLAATGMHERNGRVKPQFR